MHTGEFPVPQMPPEKAISPDTTFKLGIVAALLGAAITVVVSHTRLESRVDNLDKAAIAAEARKEEDAKTRIAEALRMQRMGDDTARALEGVGRIEAKMNEMSQQQRELMRAMLGQPAHGGTRRRGQQ